MSVSVGSTISSRDVLLAQFDSFRSELDEYNDKRERLIKTSRDITNLSKKVIFLLHRLVLNHIANASGNTAFAGPAAQGRKKLAEIQSLFRQLKPEFVGDSYWRHRRSLSPGVQEYIEALSFTHYLETGKLISHAEVQKSLCDEGGEPIFPVPLDDYLLGVSDLTGELMRFAINAISHRGGRAKAREISDFVRNCKADFEGFIPYVKHLGKKQHVTAQSLLKIEEAAYTIAVRSSEYPLPEELLDDIVRRCMSEVRTHDSVGWQGGDVEGYGYGELDECYRD